MQKGDIQWDSKRCKNERFLCEFNNTFVMFIFFFLGFYIRKHQQQKKKLVITNVCRIMDEWLYVSMNRQTDRQSVFILSVFMKSTKNEITALNTNILTGKLILLLFFSFFFSMILLLKVYSTCSKELCFSLALNIFCIFFFYCFSITKYIFRFVCIVSLFISF